MESKNPIQVADKLFLVLETLARTGPIGLSDLCREVSLNKTTVHRLLNSLLYMGYVRQDTQTSRYSLSFKIWDIANQFVSKKVKIKMEAIMNKVLEEIKKIGIVPVVVLDDAKDAEPLAKALCEGGLPCAEVTFRTEAAEESIRIISEKYPEMLVGAGTVLTTEQVDRAVAAGAKFIVSPGFNPKIVKYCIDRDIPVTPGTQTPSEMEQAIEMGLDVVKFFPAEPAGGLKMIKAVAAPYTMLQFMPTGGINLNNVEEYLEYDRILACGGSWMVKGDLVKAGKFDEIQKMTADAAALVKKIRG